jgi:hypothetical protein
VHFEASNIAARKPTIASCFHLPAPRARNLHGSPQTTPSSFFRVSVGVLAGVVTSKTECPSAIRTRPFSYWSGAPESFISNQVQTILGCHDRVIHGAVLSRQRFEQAVAASPLRGPESAPGEIEPPV